MNNTVEKSIRGPLEPSDPLDTSRLRSVEILEDLDMKKVFGWDVVRVGSRAHGQRSIGSADLRDGERVPVRRTDGRLHASVLRGPVTALCVPPRPTITSRARTPKRISTSNSAAADAAGWGHGRNNGRLVRDRDDRPLVHG